MAKKKTLSAKEKDALLKTLQARFEKNNKRHKGIEWAEVASRLENNPAAMVSLQEMEDSGGEPDVIARDKKTGAVTFVDCAAESPKGRRSICFDRQALDERKEFKPANDALSMAAEMGIEILTEEDYRFLQTLGEFDLKTSSWIATPAPIRKLGGAIFADRRYDTVFVYHNGASSYYAARGFRGKLTV